MSVSVNTTYTADTRRALSDNLSESTRSSTAMATGNAFLHAYEDPTGLAIGEQMREDLDVLSIVLTGIEQSQSMLYIAEAGIKSAYEAVTQLNRDLARAKLGYMTDELVKHTLSPSYVQLKDEVNRIANSIDFNGQKLLNGTGGKKIAAIETKVDQKPSFDLSNAVTTLKDITIDKISASVNGADASDITLDTTNSTIKVSGGALSVDAEGKKLTGAKVVVSNVDIKDSSDTPQTCNADVTISGVVLEFDKDAVIDSDGNINKGKVTFKSTDIDSGVFKDSDKFHYSFNVNSGGTIKSIGKTSVDVTPTSTEASISNIVQTYKSSGGQAAQSVFKFVTGIDLNKDLIDVSFPNINLNNENGVKGILSTLNADGLMSKDVPSSLTNLETVEDATTDIPLVRALAEQLIICLDDIGAYQKRFLNIQGQLTSAVQELDNAQGAVLNADLAIESEKNARSVAKVNIAIAQLNALNRTLSNLQRIVTG